MTETVYLLTCPITFEPKYVGRTTDLKCRLASHWSAPSPATKEWIETLRPTGKRPIVTSLKKCDGRSYVAKWECFYIYTIQKEYGTLLNISGIKKGNNKELMRLIGDWVKKWELKRRKEAKMQLLSNPISETE